MLIVFVRSTGNVPKLLFVLCQHLCRQSVSRCIAWWCHVAEFASSLPHTAAAIVYINGIEVPVVRISRRYGVWQVPEVQVSMIPDPVLTRLGAEDRVQLEVFYLDDTAVDPSVVPQFRLWFDGEITGWGYQSLSSGRVITFTAVAQIAIFSQLFVQFLTTFDDLLGHSTLPGVDATGVGVPTSQIVFPFSLFKQGLIPGQGLTQDTSSIVRPFDFLYNVIRNMIGAQVPREQQTIPAANFFARWSRLTNFHNRFVASPFFDEIVDNPNIFPVLRALQNVSAVDTIARNLIPNVQNSGSIWDMLQLVFQTMLFEIAMIPSMPLVATSLSSGLIQQTNFSDHALAFDATHTPNGAFVSALAGQSRKTTPRRIPNYFPKPQTLFGIAPSCNVIFPSQLVALAYDENYAVQPTRLYFNDETLLNLLRIPRGGYRETVHNALTIAYPPEADAAMHARARGGGKLNGKNLLLWPEEFFKGPVLDRRDVPPWLFFLKQSEQAGAPPTGRTADGAVETTSAPARTPRVSAPAAVSVPPGTMATTGRVGTQAPDGIRVFGRAVENLRSKVTRLGTAAGIPTDFLLAWISHESDGDVRSLDRTQNARGLFQITGPHVSGGTAVTLRQTEAGQIGLGLADTGTGPDDVSARLSTDVDFSLQAGVKLVQFYRRVANKTRVEQGLLWSEGDMWRLTKMGHNGIEFERQAIQTAKAILGRPPASWEEMYKVVVPTVSAGFVNVLNNATAVGGVVAGSSGSMITKSDPRPTRAPTATPAPRTSSDIAAAPATPTTAPASPQVSEAVTASLESAETVYQLYAKYEFFRERYAKRSGSAQIAWNPYVVAGFPAVIFDHRSSRVDIACYVTTVQDVIDLSASSARKSTTISFLYGRQLQEMFDLMARQFADGEASAGAAPAEPIRDVRKVIQSFTQAEVYYQQLFYGGQSLFNKDASFDFRKIIGYASDVPNGSPVSIFVDGPEEADQDDLATAQVQLAQLTNDRADKAAQLASVNAGLISASAQASALNATTSNTASAQLSALGGSISDATTQVAQLQTELSVIDTKIQKALSVIQSTQDVTRTAQVTHNLVGTRELVPLASAAPLFNGYDNAMRYAWRPICTLDEYVVFHDGAGEGLVSAAGSAGSLGATYYSRIRRMTAPTSDELTALRAPRGADGLSPAQTSTDPQTVAQLGTVNAVTGQPAQAPSVTATVPGLTNAGFPQVRADWDQALLAYRTNVRSVKAPRT